jgi:hypothetical protein
MRMMTILKGFYGMGTQPKPPHTSGRPLITVVKATFLTNGTRTTLEKELDAGYPVACGILHHGPAHAPRGGGHWMLVVGLTDTHVVCHDPYGEMDNANGGYPKPGWGGKNISYTWKNWSKRWMVDGNGSGWYMTFRKLNQKP